MKKYLEYFILWGVFTVIIYLIFSFYSVSFNIITWSKESRFIAILCWVSICGSSLTYQKEQ